MGPVETLTLSILAKNPDGLTREVIRAKLGYRQSPGRIGALLHGLGQKGSVRARRYQGRTVYVTHGHASAPGTVAKEPVSP